MGRIRLLSICSLGFLLTGTSFLFFTSFHLAPQFQYISEVEYITNNTNLTLNPPICHHQYSSSSSISSSSSSSSDEKIDLLILVCSAVKNFDERQAVRNTWGSIARGAEQFKSRVRLGFLLGATTNQSLQNKVEEEFSQYEDIIQEDFQDTYLNLTLKSVTLLRWTSSQCPEARYVLKTDDDMFINVPNLLKLIRRQKSGRNVLAGALFKGAHRITNRRDKWFVPDGQFSGTVYPDYLSGTAYVMSGDVTTKLLAYAYTTPYLFMEDVFVTGLLAQKAGVKRKNWPGFVFWRPPANGCEYRKLVSGHHVTPKEMTRIWREVNDKKLNCSVRPKKKVVVVSKGKVTKKGS